VLYKLESGKNALAFQQECFIKSQTTAQTRKREHARRERIFPAGTP